MRSADQDHASEAGELSPIKLRVQAARRARAAIGLSTIALLTIVMGTIYRLWFHERQLGIQAILVFGLFGIVLLNLGRANSSRRMTEMAILRFHTSHRFYGTVISVSAALVFCYALSLKPKVEVKARTVEAVAPKPMAEPVKIATAPEPPQPPTFPKLALTGVILSGSHSSALINGQTVMTGDPIEGVILVEIQENKVVVQKDGFRKTISRFALPETKPTKAGK